LTQKEKPAASGSRLRKSRYCCLTKRLGSSIGLANCEAPNSGCQSGDISSAALLVRLPLVLPSAEMTKTLLLSTANPSTVPEVYTIFDESGDQAGYVSS